MVERPVHWLYDISAAAIPQKNGNKKLAYHSRDQFFSRAAQKAKIVSVFRGSFAYKGLCLQHLKVKFARLNLAFAGMLSLSNS